MRSTDTPLTTEAPPAASPRTERPLGPRGRAARARLLHAARQLLRTQSPLSLTAIAIARRAGAAPPTFYVYFDSLEDLFFALAAEADEALAHLSAAFDATPWPPADPLAWANNLIDRFIAVWRDHGRAIAIRGLLADHESRRFHRARTEAQLPVVARLADRMAEARPGTEAADWLADAVLLYVSCERIAWMQASSMAWRFPPDAFHNALACQLAVAIQPGKPRAAGG